MTGSGAVFNMTIWTLPYNCISTKLKRKPSAGGVHFAEGFLYSQRGRYIAQSRKSQAIAREVVLCRLPTTRDEARRTQEPDTNSLNYRCGGFTPRTDAAG